MDEAFGAAHPARGVLPPEPVEARRSAGEWLVAWGFTQLAGRVKAGALLCNLCPAADAAALRAPPQLRSASAIAWRSAISVSGGSADSNGISSHVASVLALCTGGWH